MIELTDSHFKITLDDLYSTPVLKMYAYCIEHEDPDLFLKIEKLIEDLLVSKNSKSND